MTIAHQDIRTQLETFAKVLFNPDDLIVIDLLGASSCTVQNETEFIYARELPDSAVALQTWNSNGYNCLFGVCPRKSVNGTKRDDVVCARVIWADFDGIGPEQAQNIIENKAFPLPTLLINSGHGTHAYWKLDKAYGPEELEIVVHDLAIHLGADPSVKNANRLMRLPGFLNVKSDPVPCTIVAVDMARIYTLAVLRKLIPVSERRAVPVASANEDIISLDDNDEDRQGLLHRAEAYAQKVENVGEGGRNPAAYRLATVLRNDFQLDVEEALPILQAWNEGNRPPLTDDELNRCLANGGQYASKEKGRLVRSAMRQSTMTPFSILRKQDRYKTELKEAEKQNEQVTIQTNTGADLVNALGIPLPGHGTLLPALNQEILRELAGHDPLIHLPWHRLDRMARPLQEKCVCLVCGQPGSGKSMFCTQLILHCQMHGVPYAYLPLEDDAQHFLRRCGAMLQGSFDVMEDPQKAKEALAKHESILDQVQRHVVENPRRAQRDEEGRIHATRINGEMVLDWTQAMVKDHRLVFIDSLAMISHDSFQQWRAEDELIGDLVAIAQASRATVVLICHTVKSPGRKDRLGLEDVQGATGFTRKAQSVLILDGHDKKNSVVFDPNRSEQRRYVSHTRTVIVAKARNGGGTGKQIAFTYGQKGNPRFQEEGIILSKRELLGAAVVSQ